VATSSRRSTSSTSRRPTGRSAATTSSATCGRRRSRSRRCRSPRRTTTSPTTSSRSRAPRIRPSPLDAVRRLLARAGATVDDLENGPQEGRPEGRLGHNCSGKHAGFLAACRANGWSFAGYRLPDHPLQQRIRELLGGGQPAVDGCGIPTYAQLLSAQARLLPQTQPRIADAMRARPELVGGEGADDTALMQQLPGLIAKRGAEGLLCAASPDGRGYAFKVADGNGRALRPVVAAVLGVDELARVPLRNSRDEIVGVIELEGPVRP
jgi:hypothetical protein